MSNLPHKARISMGDAWTIEQRKAAINQMMQRHLPFNIKRMVISLPDGQEVDYTGGSTQMLMARAVCIEFLRI